MLGFWWQVVRLAFYLPILMVGANRGPLAGLSAGVAASSLFAFVVVSRGITDASWPSILAPDFAVVGLLGGTLMEVWPRFRQLNSARASHAKPAPDKTSEGDIRLDLNPISSIQSAAGLLADGDAPPELRQELFGIISTECEHLSANITDRLQQSHVAEASQFQEVDITPIIDGALSEVVFVLCGRRTMVRRELAPDLPPIQCNPDQIRNLVMSLTMIAVQSAPAGYEVILRARRGDDGVILDLRDQGQGSFVARAANWFFHSRSGATGSGLADAYDIVRQHGGTLEGKASVRKGLEFSVCLPLRRDSTHGGRQGAVSGGR
jgi:hypothetical protein